MNKVLILGVLLCSFYGCSNISNNSESTDIAEPAYRIPDIYFTFKNYFPHDVDLYTEGFLIHNGKVFESTGSPEELPQCKSMVGTYDLATGKFEKKIELEKSKYFGEGIVILNSKLYQLTYKNRIGFIYDARSFKKVASFNYDNKEGWALTTNGVDIIMSDGTNALTFLNPITLKPARIVNVTENGIPRDSLNELEFINGFIYANIWLNNHIVKIDPLNGNVVGKIDLTALTRDAESKNPNADVLNGIAYDSFTKKIFVTGKLWKNIYEIEFIH